MPLFLRHRFGYLIPIPIPVIEGADPKAAGLPKADGVRAATPTSLAQDFGRRQATEPSGDDELQFGSFDPSEVADTAELLFGAFDARLLVNAKACFSHAANGSLWSSSRQAEPAFLTQNDASGAASSEGNGFRFGFASQGGTDSLSSPINTATSPELVIGSINIFSPRSVTTSPRGVLTTPSLLLTAQAAQGTAVGLLSMLAEGRCSTAIVSHVPQVAAEGGAQGSAPGPQPQSPEPLSKRPVPGSVAHNATTAVRGLGEEEEGVTYDGRAEGQADGPDVEAVVEDGGAQVLAQGRQAGAYAHDTTAAAAPQGKEAAAPATPAPGPGRPAKPEAVTPAAEAGEPGATETVGSAAQASGASEPPEVTSSDRAAAAAALRNALGSCNPFGDAPERSLFTAHSGVRGTGSGRSSGSGRGSGSAGGGGGGDGVGGGAAETLELATVPPHHLSMQLQLCLRHAYGPEATSRFVVQEAPPPYLLVKEVLSMGRAECMQWRRQVEQAWYAKLRGLPPWQRYFSRSPSREYGAASTGGPRKAAGGGSTNEAPTLAKEENARGDGGAQQLASRDDAGPSAAAGGSAAGANAAASAAASSALAPDGRKAQTWAKESPRPSPHNGSGNGNVRHSGGGMPYNGGGAVPMVPMVMAPQYGMFPQYGMGHLTGPMGPGMVPPMAVQYMMPDGGIFVPVMQMTHPMVQGPAQAVPPYGAGGFNGRWYGNRGNYAGRY